MKILINSNAPFVGTGYGNQTDLLARQLKKEGHEVAIAAFWGLMGATLTGENGIPILPPLMDQYGNDATLYYYTKYKPDLYISLIDVWVLYEQMLKSVPVHSWIPVDHDPIPPAVANTARHCATRIAMSKFGKEKFEAADLDCIYIPHAVDTNNYVPIDRMLAREELSVDPDAFIVTIVAANKGHYPSRKAFTEMIRAWKLFTEAHPNEKMILYLHTVVKDIPYGLDLTRVLTFYGISSDKVRVADREMLLIGGYSPVAMNKIYNMSDFLLSTSFGEGFGIPVLEAQAAGTPVIVSDFTAQTELAPHGYKVPVYPDDRIYTDQHSEQFRPRSSEIVKGLEWAWENRGNARLRKKARQFALKYDVERVYHEYWKPNLPVMLANAQAHGFDEVADGD